MRIGDYLIQWWRLQIAKGWIPTGSRVLDIGCHQGELFKMLGQRIAPSVGIDPLYRANIETDVHQFLVQEFHEPLPFEDGSFDVIVLLATIEHMQEKSAVAREAKRLLRRSGLVIITIPSLFVDRILSFLLLIGFIDGMSLEEHHGFSPDDLPTIFAASGFSLKRRQKFQFGLNNLYVFERV
jgi:2-polyprenyl-3-methyl-5-hydroxy-6-metoxy-1,4-benzoquinol methylase